MDSGRNQSVGLMTEKTHVPGYGSTMSSDFIEYVSFSHVHVLRGQRRPYLDYLLSSVSANEEQAHPDISLLSSGKGCLSTEFGSLRK